MAMEPDFTPTNNTLQLSVSLIRHGERAPIVLFQNDVNKDYWPNGPGNLTSLGKQQSFELGQELRKYFDGFLNPDFKPDEVYVRSTDVERCLATAESCMAGLFPAPPGSDGYQATSHWQPVVVHSFSRLSDPCMVHLDGFVDLPSAKISPECHQFLQENKELFDKVVEVSKYPKNIFLIGMLLQGVLEEMRLGLVTPHNFGKTTEELCKILTQLYTYFVTVYPAVLVPTAHTLAACHTAIKEKLGGQKSKLRAYLFFTHDVVMSCFLTVLCDEFEKPGYMAAIFFEVHKHPDNGQFYVKVSYKNGLQKKPRDIKLRGCNSLCPIGDFEKVVNGFIKFYALNAIA